MRFVILLLALAAAPVAAADAPVRFNRDVRPILADHCVHCHGPDKARRKADLRFDLEPGSNGLACVTPGKPNDSELFKRITSKDDAERMPPAHANRPLSPAQI